MKRRSAADRDSRCSQPPPLRSGLIGRCSRLPHCVVEAKTLFLFPSTAEGGGGCPSEARAGGGGLGARTTKMRSVPRVPERSSGGWGRPGSLDHEDEPRRVSRVLCLGLPPLRPDCRPAASPPLRLNPRSVGGDGRAPAIRHGGFGPIPHPQGVVAAAQPPRDATQRFPLSDQVGNPGGAADGGGQNATMGKPPRRGGPIWVAEPSDPLRRLTAAPPPVGEESD